MLHQTAPQFLAGRAISGATRIDFDLARSVLVAFGIAVTFVNINAARAETLQAELESRLSSQVEHLVAGLTPYRDRFAPSISHP